MFWFFFSGYGVNYQEKDYLMPVLANPELISETGIEVRSLMQSLQIANLNVLLILDINRAFGTQADAPVGQEIIELAKELHLATILSCQPEQFSHESRELGYGFFTAALLEALRSGSGSNLIKLADHLNSLTPQLCQHYWRPIQDPVTIIPSRQPVILPSTEITNELAVEAVIFPEENFAVVRTAPPLAHSTQERGWWTQGKTAATTLSKTTSVEKSPHHQLSLESTTEPVAKSLSTSLEETQGGRFIPSARKTSTSNLSSQRISLSLGQQFILWSTSILAIVALIATYLLHNQANFQIKDLLIATPKKATNDRQVINPLSPPIVPKPTVTTQIASPTEPKNPSSALLELQKMSLKPTQAKDLSLAIAAAHRIKPGEPLYQQAQENIQIWSQMILDLAVERVKQRQYANAIATAQFITKNEPLYPQVQAAIKQWQLESKQYLSNKTLLDAANALIITGQASTYNRAIEVAKKVLPSEPGFDNAQKAINKWSEKILDLAKNRAARGEFSAAIETAALVPEVTPAYEDAQDAIQKWQKKIR